LGPKNTVEGAWPRTEEHLSANEKPQFIEGSGLEQLERLPVVFGR
jgi:hypothetical protein